MPACRAWRAPRQIQQSVSGAPLASRSGPSATSQDDDLGLHGASPKDLDAVEGAILAAGDPGRVMFSTYGRCAEVKADLAQRLRDLAASGQVEGWQSLASDFEHSIESLRLRTWLDEQADVLLIDRGVATTYNEPLDIAVVLSVLPRVPTP